MSTHVIGSRYQLERVVTRTVEVTTWRACDRWLRQPVLVVTPEPANRRKFEDVAATLREQPSPHLLGLYDAGPTPAEFVAFGVPPVTLAEDRIPRDEDDVLAAGRSLGDAVAALHDRGIVHGNIHPGSVVPREGGDVASRPGRWRRHRTTGTGREASAATPTSIAPPPWRVICAHSVRCSSGRWQGHRCSRASRWGTSNVSCRSVRPARCTSSTGR